MASDRGCPEAGVASCNCVAAARPGTFTVSASPVAPALRNAARREKRRLPEAGERSEGRFMLILLVHDRSLGEAACLVRRLRGLRRRWRGHLFGAPIIHSLVSP